MISFGSFADQRRCGRLGQSPTVLVGSLNPLSDISAPRAFAAGYLNRSEVRHSAWSEEIEIRHEQQRHDFSVQPKPFFSIARGYEIGRRCVCHVIIIEDETLVALDPRILLEAYGGKVVRLCGKPRPRRSRQRDNESTTSSPLTWLCWKGPDPKLSR